MSKHDPAIPTRGDAIRLLGEEQEKVRRLGIELAGAENKIKALEQSREVLAEANNHLFYKLEKEKKEMPRKGVNVWAYISAVTLSAAGYFMPAAPLACCSATFTGNLYQLTAVVLLLILFAGPFALRVLGAIKDPKAE